MWLERRGHRVIRTASSYWYESGPRVFQAFPYHWLISPGEEELHHIFWEQKAVGLRYSAPFHSPQGVVSYHVVYSGEEYPLDALPQKARYDVRRGLGHITAERIPLARLATEGWQTRAETLLRQRRAGAENRAWWERLCHSAEGIHGFEAWGAISDGEMVASLLAFLDNDCCSILYQQSKTAHLRNGINNALTYSFTQEAISRHGISLIFYGLHSLDAPASVDEFKFRMRFAAKPVRQRVVLHPFFAPVVDMLPPSIVNRLSTKLRAMHPLAAKAEGFLRFYMQGRRALADQPWPECLAQHKEELIRTTTQSYA